MLHLQSKFNNLNLILNLFYSNYSNSYMFIA